MAIRFGISRGCSVGAYENCSVGYYELKTDTFAKEPQDPINVTVYHHDNIVTITYYNLPLNFVVDDNIITILTEPFNKTGHKLYFLSLTSLTWNEENECVMKYKNLNSDHICFDKDPFNTATYLIKHTNLIESLNSGRGAMNTKIDEEHSMLITSTVSRGSLSLNSRRNVMSTKFDVDHSMFLMPTIKDVIFNNPYTIVKWSDGSMTKVRCVDKDDFNEEVGLSMAISRKYFENAKFEKEPFPRASFLKCIKNAKRPNCNKD